MTRRTITRFPSIGHNIVCNLSSANVHLLDPLWPPCNQFWETPPNPKDKKMLENQSIDKKRDQFVFDAAAEMALLAERPWEGSSLPSCCRAAPITISRVFVFLYLFVLVSLLPSLPSCCSRSKISPPKGEIGSDYDPNLFRIVQYGKKSWLRTK